MQNRHFRNRHCRLDIGMKSVLVHLESAASRKAEMASCSCLGFGVLSLVDPKPQDDWVRRRKNVPNEATYSTSYHRFGLQCQ